ncbi:lipoprotein chaperone [compost metagenome]
MIKALKTVGKAVLPFLIFSVSTMAFAKSSTALNAVTKKYRSAKMVEMNVDKTIKSELLGKETLYKGKIFLSGGKFRWENTTPEETLLIFDGSTIWSVQIPPKEFGGPVQVARGKVDKKTKSQILISALLGNEPIEKNFKVLKEKKSGDVTTVEVAPQGNDLTIKTLNLVLNTKDKALAEVSYLDDVGNLTTMKFSGIKFLKKEDKKLFKYQPPKDAQVSDL